MRFLAISLYLPAICFPARARVSDLVYRERVLLAEICRILGARHREALTIVGLYDAQGSRNGDRPTYDGGSRDRADCRSPPSSDRRPDPSASLGPSCCGFASSIVAPRLRVVNELSTLHTEPKCVHGLGCKDKTDDTDYPCCHGLRIPTQPIFKSCEWSIE